MDLNQCPTQVETESIDGCRALNKINSNSACPRNFITSLRFCFVRNSEMEGRRELSDVLN
jgi:hypothetical protein